VSAECAPAASGLSIGGNDDDNAPPRATDFYHRLRPFGKPGHVAVRTPHPPDPVRELADEARRQSDPAEVATQLRRFAALHDVRRWRLIALAFELQAYAGRLLVEADAHGRVVGRLRLDAQHYEADAERVRRQRPLARKLQHLRDAA
jgi:hypothetical protein